MKHLLHAVQAAVCAASFTQNTLLFVTQNTDGATGNIGAYTGSNNLAYVGTCPEPLHDIYVNTAADILLVSGRQQIFNQTLSTADGCGAPLLTSVPQDFYISHVATDGTWVYFTEYSTSAVYRASVAGGAATCIVADGGDGIVNGKRIGITVVNGTVLYAARGFDATSPSTPLSGLVQTGLNGENPTLLFTYASSQPWWLTDLAVSLPQATFVGAEFRNDSSGATNNVQQSSWPLGNIEPLMTGIAPADEDNTFITYDDSIANMAWFTNAGTNQLNALNATARNALPVLMPFFAVPAANGTVQGVAFVGGTDIAFPYCSSPLSPC